MSDSLKKMGVQKNKKYKHKKQNKKKTPKGNPSCDVP